jgi:hypothetical protein
MAAEPTDPTSAHRSPTLSSVLGTLGGLGSAVAVVTQVRWVSATTLAILGSILVSLATGSILTRVLLGPAKRSGHLSSSVLVAAISTLAFGLVVLLGGIVGLPPSSQANGPGQGRAADATGPPGSSAATSPPAVTSHGPNVTGEGSVLAQYTVDVSSTYGINFGAGPAPQPFEVSYDGADLAYSSFDRFSTRGKLALLDGSVTYAECKADTRYTYQIDDSGPGMSMCFTGRTVIAAIQVTKVGDAGSGKYVTLAVTVWRTS